jgi:hypothetical protein
MTTLNGFEKGGERFKTSDGLQLRKFLWALDGPVGKQDFGCVLSIEVKKERRKGETDE